MTSKDEPPGSTCKSIVTQMYTFSSLSKQKAVANGHASSSMLPYVGFPGLSLTPIPENPLLDPSHNDDTITASERERWMADDEVDLQNGSCKNGSCRNGPNPYHHSHRNPIKNGSLPKHWLGNGTLEGLSIEEIENGGLGKSSSSSSPSKVASCSGASSATAALNVHVVQTTTFLPKDEAMTREEKRAHLCKLLLFALVGFLIVVGIVLWIFSPAFT